MLIHQILTFITHEKNINFSDKSNKFEISAPTLRQKNLNYLTDQIQYQIFKIILSISSKSMKR